MVNEYLDAKYDQEEEIEFSFRVWVNYLRNFYYHHRAGRDLNTIGLLYRDWDALSVITEFLNDQEWIQQQKMIWGSK